MRHAVGPSGVHRNRLDPIGSRVVCNHDAKRHISFVSPIELVHTGEFGDSLDHSPEMPFPTGTIDDEPDPGFASPWRSGRGLARCSVGLA
jgi:hypothetical protein